VDELTRDFHAIILCGGSTIPRDLMIPGRELKGTYFAMDFLKQQNQRVRGVPVLEEDILATGKNVIVIGGGDTGSDCVGTSNRQGAKTITQFELLMQPPEQRTQHMPWPTYPMLLKTTSSHEEGVNRFWGINTEEFLGDEQGNLKAIRVNDVTWEL